MNYITHHQDYARWASEEEIKSSLFTVKLNDYNPQYGGIPLYADSDSIYIESTDAHSLIIGSTGSKKSRLIGMPALQMYTKAGESFICTDPKAELYERTLPFLKEHEYRVFVLNLRDPEQSNSWNPFLVPYRLYHSGRRDKAIELVIDMAICIAKSDYHQDPYWQNSAADLLAGLILVLFECGKEDEIHFRSLQALRTQAFIINRHDEKPFIREYFLQHLGTDAFVRSLLNGTAEVTESTRSCIISVFDQSVRPFFNQSNLIDMLSGSDIEMCSIGKEKTAVFLIIPDENTLYHSLVSVFVKQCYTELLFEAQKQPSKSLPRRVNFMLDEFSALPQISDFPTMITASRSRNIRFNLIVQSISQLYQRYGSQVETIKGNCENWVFLHSKELGLLRELIELCGMKNADETLVTVSRLLTMDKNKGEAFILHKRLHPYIACLPDIDSYTGISHEYGRAFYPENTRKTQSVFNFSRFCSDNDNFFISKLFKGMTFEEINNISNEERERFYMIDEECTEPIFTVSLYDEE